MREIMRKKYNLLNLNKFFKFNLKKKKKKTIKII